jgi:hypothetical protein
MAKKKGRINVKIIAKSTVFVGNLLVLANLFGTFLSLLGT